MASFQMRGFRRGCPLAVLIAAAALAATEAQAVVTISSNPTVNMSCSNGVCAPTAVKAVLNAGELETLLASGNVAVVTNGPGVQAKDIAVKAPVAWSSGSVLTLDAYKSVTIDQPVSITGTAGLAIDLDDGGNNGALSFGAKGNVTFADLSSSLTINGASYTLVGDLKTLASDIASNPKVNVALANSYDANGDGTYSASPISTTFGGAFVGLGNTISNLAIDDPTLGQNVGLFAKLASGGSLSSIGVVNAKIRGVRSTDKYLVETVGALVGYNEGSIAGSYATGAVKGGRYNKVGGLAGISSGRIAASHATDNVHGKENIGGGLVGSNRGTITDCYATGSVSGFDVGGLVGFNDRGTIKLSFATGAVNGFDMYWGGGLVGANTGKITLSYATGAVSSDGQSSDVGGLVGENDNTITYSFATGDANGATSGGLAGNNTSTILNSYSTGAAAGRDYAGGLTGGNTGSIGDAYSTGAVTGGGYIGGLIGYDGANKGNLMASYWDTDTSGVTNLSQGAGNIANDPGITGLTTEQFQSGLPAGFDPKVWAEDSKVIDGFPYLLKNPPPQ